MRTNKELSEQLLKLAQNELIVGNYFATLLEAAAALDLADQAERIKELEAREEKETVGRYAAEKEEG